MGDVSLFCHSPRMNTLFKTLLFFDVHTYFLIEFLLVILYASLLWFGHFYEWLSFFKRRVEDDVFKFCICNVCVISSSSSSSSSSSLVRKRVEGKAYISS